MPDRRPFVRHLRGYVEFTGKITLRTGLLIGGGDVGLEIGGIDRSVIRDPVSGLPYIPGTSLKGKLRALVEKDWKLRSERRIEPGYRHECSDLDAALNCRLCRLFGSTAEGDEAQGNRNLPGTFLFRDCLMPDDHRAQMEYKMENTLDRLTAAATPRTIERVAPDPHDPKAYFELNLLWRIEDISVLQVSPDAEGQAAVTGTATAGATAQMRPLVSYDALRVATDLQTLLRALRLLEYEGLGSSTSRGYGRVNVGFDTITVISDGGTKEAEVLANVLASPLPQETEGTPMPEVADEPLLMKLLRRTNALAEKISEQLSQPTSHEENSQPTSSPEQP